MVISLVCLVGLFQGCKCSGIDDGQLSYCTVPGLAPNPFHSDRFSKNILTQQVWDKATLGFKG